MLGDVVRLVCLFLTSYVSRAVECGVDIFPSNPTPTSIRSINNRLLLRFRLRRRHQYCLRSPTPTLVPIPSKKHYFSVCIERTQRLKTDYVFVFLYSEKLLKDLLKMLQRVSQSRILLKNNTCEQRNQRFK